MNAEYIHKELTGIADLIEKKNHDYGDAYRNCVEDFRNFPPERVYPVSKIREKDNRIYTLSKEDNKVANEGLKDALRDCIGYCALYLDLLDEEEKAKAKSDWRLS